MAIALPLLVTLMLGIVSSGQALNRTNALNNAARESARFGATLAADNLVLWLNQVASVAENSASGDLDDGVDGRTICVAYVHPDGDLPSDSSIGSDHTIRMVVNPSGTKKVTAGEACYSDGRTNSERRVQVQVQRSVELNFVFAQPSVSIDSVATAPFERVE